MSKVNTKWVEKDFVLLKMPEQVRWWNSAVELARDRGMISYRPVTKFENREKGAKRCAVLASALRASEGGEDRVKVRRERAAAEPKAAKPSDRRTRVASVPCRAAGDMRPVSPGSDRYKVLAAADGKKLPDIAKKVGMEANYVRQHLWVANRDMGVGYSIDADGLVSLTFPRGKTLADYTRAAA